MLRFGVVTRQSPLFWLEEEEKTTMKTQIVVPSVIAAMAACAGNALAANTATALSEARRAYAAEPSDATHALRLGAALVEAGNVDEGAALIDQALAQDPTLESPFASFVDGAGEMQLVERGSASGPDVIVGDIYDPRRWGASGGITAYSLGTISCNLGTSPLLWQSWNNNHPVIGQSIYRVDNGIFDMIGIGWLKHGFAALTQNLCGACQNPGTQTLLGVNCSDPYSGFLNGDQSGVGPRWQVNASTGFFPYPHANPSYSGSIARRTQVANDDWTSTGIFLAEAHYVTNDDAANGNHYNNVSYRRILVGSAPNYSISLTGAFTTQREKPAIQGWQDLDSGVKLEQIDVPENGTSFPGRMIFGTRVHDLGDGTYRYVYVLYNMNSDRSANAISFPSFPGVGANATDFHFNDPNYHSNDGVNSVTFDGTDWSFVYDDSSFGWDGPASSFANGNAVRWGTAYTYSFVSNRPPVRGEVEVSLFKAGPTTNVVTASTDIPCGFASDLSGNGIVDFSDLNMLLADFGVSYDFTDLNELLSSFSDSCFN